ncbi:MAG TPA: HEAT repeat domain-containing protein, partial [Kofleriaceae bacterium]|nr:HEAT repeat domain-containing protein [Kofleriaceae bacterium]
MPPGNTPTSSPAHTGPNVTDAEIEQHLTLAVTAHGNRADLAGKEAALRWLADHADRAYPIVLEHAKATPTPSLIEVVGRLARPEATAWLAQLLRTAGPTSGAAGVALGRSPDPRARDALVEALTAHEPDVVISAVDGLRV